MIQKIDHIKSQLSAMADLLTTVGDEEDGEELDEEEYKILQNAGMIFKSSAKGKARETDSKHVVFVENDAEGTFECYLGAFSVTKIFPGRDYRSPSGIYGYTVLPVLQEGSVEDLGWKPDENTKKRRKRKSAVNKSQDVDMDADSRMEEAKVCLQALQIPGLC